MRQRKEFELLPTSDSFDDRIIDDGDEVDQRDYAQRHFHQHLGDGLAASSSSRHREFPDDGDPPHPPAITSSEMENITDWSRGGVELRVDRQHHKNDSVTFKDSPVKCWCSACETFIVSHVELSSGWMSVVIALLCFCILGTAAFCVLPFVWPLSQDVVHLCPRCWTSIARKSRVALPRFEKDILTLRCGSCALVLAKKYVVILLAILVVIFFVCIGRWLHLFGAALGSSEYHERGPNIPAPWEEFLLHCGYRSRLGNPIHASYAFTSRFEGNTVEWGGMILAVKEAPVPWLDNLLLIRMTPPQYAGISEATRDNATQHDADNDDSVKSTVGFVEDTEEKVSASPPLPSSAETAPKATLPSSTKPSPQAISLLSLSGSYPPDLALLFDSALDPVIADLAPGDNVQFNATLLRFGRRRSPHVARLWEIRLKGQT